jgi:hypothetical protein
VEERYWDVEVSEKGMGMGGGEEEGGVQKVVERRPNIRKRGMEQRIVSRIR